MASAEVFVAADGQGLAFEQAQTDAVGTFDGLVPYRTELQPGPLEVRAFRLAGNAVDHHAAGIGQQDRVAAATQLLMQAVHLPVRDADHLLQLLAMLVQTRLLDHAGGPRTGRIEVMLIQAAPPGSSNGGISSGPMGRFEAFAETEDLMGMPSDVR